jgi:astacin
LGLSSFSTGSIMHYGAYDFAKDERYPTITSKKNDGQQLGQREGFSNVCSILHFQK